MFGNVKTMTCNQVYASAAAAGAITKATGMDTFFSAYPPWVPDDPPAPTIQITTLGSRGVV